MRGFGKRWITGGGISLVMLLSVFGLIGRCMRRSGQRGVPGVAMGGFFDGGGVFVCLWFSCWEAFWVIISGNVLKNLAKNTGKLDPLVANKFDLVAPKAGS